MITHCPECKNQHSISIEELRTTLGILVCENCGKEFNALELIQGGMGRNSKKNARKKKTRHSKKQKYNSITKNTEEPKIQQQTIANQGKFILSSEIPHKNIKKPLPASENTQPLSSFLIEKPITPANLEQEIESEKELSLEEIAFLEVLENPPKQNSKFWLPAVGLSALLLIFQWLYFEAYGFTQNIKVRPWLNKVSTKINYQLPPYKNISDFSIIQGTFEKSDNNHYEFTASLINQSVFPQQYPSIKLSLIDFKGQTLAERIFLPNDYLIAENNTIAANMSVQITMKIATPLFKFGGYQFELL